MTPRVHHANQKRWGGKGMSRIAAGFSDVEREDRYLHILGPIVRLLREYCYIYSLLDLADVLPSRLGPSALRRSRHTN